MKTKRLLIVLMAAVLGMPGVYAQKVVVEGIKTIIDASETNHTTDKKPQTTTGTNSISCTQSISDIASGINNEKVYKKFEVSKTDMRQTDNSTTSNWREAIDLCAKLATDGVGWRLPTQRELMLMWVLKGELERTSGFIPFVAEHYWSATEGDGDFGATVWFECGSTSGSRKRSPNQRVRCIRDI